VLIDNNINHVSCGISGYWKKINSLRCTWSHTEEDGFVGRVIKDVVNVVDQRGLMSLSLSET